MTTTTEVRSTGEVPGDWRMAKRLWPFLLASAVSLIPFTVFGMYLVPIAAAADGSVAEIGGLRGLEASQPSSSASRSRRSSIASPGSWSPPEALPCWASQPH